MKRLFPVLLFFSSLAVSAQQWAWVKDLGPYMNGMPHYPQMTTLSGGDAIVLNQFEQAAVKSCSMRRVNPAGQVLWVDSTSGNHPVTQIMGDHVGNYYTIGNDTWISNGYTSSYLGGTILTALDGNGLRKWSKSLEGNAKRMTVTWDGDIVIVEYGYIEIIYERYDVSGNLLAKKSIPFGIKAPDVPKDITIQDVACDNNGFIYISGNYVGDSINFNNSGYDKSKGSLDAFILKLDKAGNIQAKEYMADILPWRMQCDYHNNIYFLFLARDNVHVRNATIKQQYGHNYAALSYYMAKLNSSGGCNWIKEIERYGIFDDDLYYEMDVAPDGEFYVTGKTLDTLYLGNTQIPMTEGIFVLKADSSGNFLWAKHAACFSYYSGSWAISYCSNHAIYISGSFKNTLTADAHQLTGSYQQFLGVIADGALTTNVSDDGSSFKSFLNIAPNPSSGIFDIKSSETIQSINVYDLQLKMVGEKIPFQYDRVDVSFLTPGVYMVEVKSIYAVERKKVVIQ